MAQLMVVKGFWKNMQRTMSGYVFWKKLTVDWLVPARLVLLRLVGNTLVLLTAMTGLRQKCLPGYMKRRESIMQTAFHRDMFKRGILFRMHMIRCRVAFIREIV